MTIKRQSIHTVPNEYDKEWVDLITEAKKMGISPDEVRIFLKKDNHKERSTDIINF